MRDTFILEIASLPPDIVFYVDECGIDEFIYRQYAYAPRGTAVSGKISGRKFKHTNVVAAKCGGKIFAPLIYDGTTDSVLFEFWFETMLLKVLPIGSVIVLDNASFHRKNRLSELAAQAGCIVKFLPPYSPDLNPIEKYWAWLKHTLRAFLPMHSSFLSALLDCF